MATKYYIETLIKTIKHIMPSEPPFDCLARNGYDIGFCGCFNDPVYCVASFFCPCIVVGKMTGEMEGGDFNVVSCLCCHLGAYKNRRAIQDKCDHHESEDGTMCGIGLCTMCAITQDFHEWQKKRPATTTGNGTQPSSVRGPTAP